MASRIKNSISGKLLQVLLIGYFLVSSINPSNTFGNLLRQDAPSYSATGMVTNILKKLFKCDGCPEELEELDAKLKLEKENKGLFFSDYFMPEPGYVLNEFVRASVKGKRIVSPFFIISDFHTKIHLPPPEFTV